MLSLQRFLWCCLRLGASPQVLGLSSWGFVTKGNRMWFLSFLTLHPLPEEPSACRGPGTPLVQHFGSLFSSKPSRAFMMGPEKAAEGISPINRISANSWEVMVRLVWAQNYSHRRSVLRTCSFA